MDKLAPEEGASSKKEVMGAILTREGFGLSTPDLCSGFLLFFVSTFYQKRLVARYLALVLCLVFGFITVLLLSVVYVLFDFWSWSRGTMTWEKRCLIIVLV